MGNLREFLRLFLKKFIWLTKKSYLPQVIQSLQQTELFSDFDPQKLHDLCYASRLRIFREGALILKEGDPGHSCFVIIEGSVRVFTYDPSGSEIAIARLEKNQYFGEQALLLEEGIGSRNASIKALTKVILLEIFRPEFVKLFNQDKKLKNTLESIGKKELLSRVESQHSVYQSILSQLKETGEEEIKFFARDQIIFSENDSPDYAYLLLSGIVEIHFSFKQQRQKIEIHPGHLFGELAILANQKRAATARATQAVRVLRIGAEKFRKIYAGSPDLQKLFGSLYSVYQLPMSDSVYQYLGKIADRDALFTTFKMKDGSVVLSSRIIQSPIFSISRQETPAEKISQTVRYEDRQQNFRELVIHHGKCVSCSCSGKWEELPKVCEIVLDQTEISPQQLESFSQTGSLFTRPPLVAEEEGAIVCNCMRVTRGAIVAAIQRGANRYQVVSKETGAGSVCGGCQFQILTLLGQSQWIPAKIESVQERNQTTRSYCLKSVDIPLPPFKPGQYITIQAFIHDRWIERSYTLSSYQDHPENTKSRSKKNPKDYFLVGCSIKRI